MFTIVILILVIGRLQAFGAFGKPVKRHPVWKWAVGMGGFLTLLLTAMIFLLESGFADRLVLPTAYQLFFILLVFAGFSAWFSLYFKLLRATVGKPVLHHCIYWGAGIFSPFILQNILGFLSLLMNHPLY